MKLLVKKRAHNFNECYDINGYGVAKLNVEKSSKSRAFKAGVKKLTGWLRSK